MVKTITAFICQMRSTRRETQIKQMIKYCDSYSYFYKPDSIKIFIKFIYANSETTLLIKASQSELSRL